MLRILNLKITLLQMFMLLTVACFGVFLATKLYVEDKLDKRSVYFTETNPVRSNVCEEEITRSKEYKFISPILLVDKECESANFASIKTDLIDMIEESKAKGSVNSASVYVKDFNSNEWFSINGEEKYMPASLMKVPFLITFLKMSELHPELLQQQLTFTKVHNQGKTQSKVEETIVYGKTYSVKELLSYMIKYSDNNATFLLSEIIDNNVLNAVFKDFGLNTPQLGSTNLFMTSAEYSRFMRAIFNGGYLTKSNSEFALNLLTTSTFNEGIKKGIPNSITVAHKFGEAGDNAEQQLHESGIVYLANKPYLITIMSRGNSQNLLELFLQSISSKVYDSFRS